MSKKVDVEAGFDATTLNGKSIILTGGASGIGEAIPRAFTSAGAFVTFLDASKERGSGLEAEFGESKIAFVHGDVVKWSDQVRLFEVALERCATRVIDIVIANAGIMGDDDIVHTVEGGDGKPVEPHLSTLNVNTLGMVYTAKLALYHFGKQPRPKSGDRCLIMTASISAYVDTPEGVQYATSKWAIRGLFRNLRGLMRKKGMLVNIIAPWLIKTRIGGQETAEGFTAAGPSFCDVQDAARAAMHLAADKSINGRSLLVAPRDAVPKVYVDEDLDERVAERILVRWTKAKQRL